MDQLAVFVAAFQDFAPSQRLLGVQQREGFCRFVFWKLDNERLPFAGRQRADKRNEVPSFGSRFRLKPNLFQSEWIVLVVDDDLHIHQFVGLRFDSGDMNKHPHLSVRVAIDINIRVIPVPDVPFDRALAKSGRPSEVDRYRGTGGEKQRDRQ